MDRTPLPGRLGDPSMCLATDPRVDPRLRPALQRLGISQNTYLTSSLGSDAPHEAVRAFILRNESFLEQLYHGLDFHVPIPNGGAGGGDETPISTSTETILGRDSNPITLTTFRPTSAPSPLPAVIYFHGGGMIILSSLNPKHTWWCRSLAQCGLAVVLVSFRNALSPLSPGLDAPFPAGLHDCASAVRAIAASRGQRGFGKLVLQGESGGANLAIATALLAKREGWIDGAVDGVVMCAPYISGAYAEPEAWRRGELGSTVECDGYLIDAATGGLNARMYDPKGENARNALAWPYWATEGELRGLPPCLVMVDELDPLRDEGVRFLRKLLEAGVRAVGKVNLGMVHEGENFLRKEVPEVFLSSLMDIKGFVESIC